MNTFGKNIKMLRLEVELTGEELASKFGLTKSAVSSWERRSRFPDEKLLKDLASFFNVSVDFLLGVSDIRNPISPDVKTFAQELLDSLIAKGIINDENDIDDTITELIINAVKLDIKQQKGTK